MDEHFSWLARPNSRTLRRHGAKLGSDHRRVHPDPHNLVAWPFPGIRRPGRAVSSPRRLHLCRILQMHRRPSGSLCQTPLQRPRISPTISATRLNAAKCSAARPFLWTIPLQRAGAGPIPCLIRGIGFGRGRIGNRGRRSRSHPVRYGCYRRKLANPVCIVFRR
jgi:hypothetical protein